jgi:hypothetical protein
VNTLEKPIEQKHLLWIILGPLSLFCSMGILSLKHTGHLIGLPLVSLIGILCCYQWKWRGLALTAALFIGLSFFRHDETQDRLWELTFGISIVLGLMITILSLDYFQDHIHKKSAAEMTQLSLLIKDNEANFEENKQKLEMLLQNQLKDKAEIEQLKNLIHSKESSYLKSAEAQERETKTLLQNQLNNKAEIEQLKNLIQSKESSYLKSAEAQERETKTLLQNQLNDKAEIEQLKNLIQHNENSYRNRIENDQQEIKTLIEEKEEWIKNQQGVDSRTLWQAKRKAEGLYEQLRDQFEDKCLCLEQTRRELFHTNEALLRMQNDEIEREFYDNCDVTNRLVQHIILMEDEYQKNIKKLESENEGYFRILDNLTS